MKSLQTKPRPATPATQRHRHPSPASFRQITVFSKNGKMITLTAAKLNNQEGVVNVKHYRYLETSPWMEWEACVNGKDVDCATTSQSWYNTLEDAICDRPLQKELDKLSQSGYTFTLPDGITGDAIWDWMEDNVPLP